ncbi:SAVED domain-containing protein [Halomonas daqingensis]|uniref:SAVED domain-containing protein n=1 Tax=Billgrantia desiderata TaxID=52021 RepID=A0ABS9B8P5_9GAMM|nr:SAVED domain-containing protein [Halomonas desiderata]MCE8043946.1 SAVED domain-containing protein [Halomonas desiderata]MCE8048520.1 SAVED domain-containing protein [Halomonas desiderata]
MSKAVAPRWHGDNYQSRFFWIHAASLLDPERPEVVEVTFEADGPKAFDDVIVRYNPGRPRASGPGRVTVDYHQIKWHADRSGRFGFSDMVDPKFIGATSISILERLKAARENAEDGAAFHLITTDRVMDGDQLSELISPVDGSLRLQVLRKGKTDNSRMGAVRKCWREHLKLSSDEGLYDLLDGLHITEGHHSLETLRNEVSLRFRLVGLVGAESETAFIYDEAARQLLIKDVNRFDRAGFEEWCRTEKWLLPNRPMARRSIAISTFEPGPTPAHMREASPEHTLSLVPNFEGRALRSGVYWADLKAPITDFLRRMLGEQQEMRLFLDAHASVAFLAGSILKFKLGADVEIVQRGVNNPGVIWGAYDGSEGPSAVIAHEVVGEGRDIAIAVGISRDPIQQVREYAKKELSNLGIIMHVALEGGVGQAAILGGQHAATIAAMVAAEVTSIRKPGGTVHIFVSGPNAFSFLLGQQAEAMGKCIPYEFDFSCHVDGSYQPTFHI